MRSRKKAPMLPPLYRRGSPCIAACLPIMPVLTRYGLRVAVRAPGRSLSGLRYHSHDLERDALAHRPPGSAAAQRPGPHPVMTADQSRWRIPAVARRAVAVLAKPFRPGRIRQGPSMYEMEGPCPASPHRLASCLAVPAPRAARRGQVPVRGTGLPAPPTFPGSPPGGARFRTVKTFLLPQRARRKSPRPAISGFPAIHEGIHRKQAVIRISQRLSTGLLTACPQATGCKPENT